MGYPKLGMRVAHSPHDTLRARADGFEVLVALDDGEARVADLKSSQRDVCRRRMGHGLPQAVYEGGTLTTRYPARRSRWA